jgi:hypothetical protein
MRARLVASFAVAALVATAAAGVAAQPRRAMLGYSAADDNFTVGTPEEYQVVGTGDPAANYDFEVRTGETSVTAMILDDAEHRVSGIVTQWKRTQSTVAGPATWESYEAVTWHRFCESTRGPVLIKPKLPVRIVVMEGTCKDGTPSTPTTGDLVLDSTGAEPAPSNGHESIIGVPCGDETCS